MAETKLVRDLRKAANDGGKLYTQAIVAIQHKDECIAALVRTNCNLERQMAEEMPDGLSLEDYGRKDLEAAIAAAEPLRLRIVLDSIFGAA
jgi:hypothetical protein